MGFSNVTGKYRPTRGGCETATQRKKRRYRTGDQETAQDIRVVKKQKSERAVGDRAPAQLPKQKSAAQKRLKALVKKNEDIKKLRTQKPEIRSAQREAAMREVKERAKEKTAAKQKAKASQPKQSKQMKQP